MCMLFRWFRDAITDVFRGPLKLTPIMNEEMIRKMLEVPWGQRKTKSGDARAVPGALLSINSPDARVRYEAYWSIDNYVVVQSDLYESALDVVPFLIELARERPLYGRDRVYDLLIEIACGSVPDDVTATDLSGKKIPLQTACHKAVALGRDVYNRDLNDEDPLIRSQVADLIDQLDMLSE